MNTQNSAWQQENKEPNTTVNNNWTRIDMKMVRINKATH